MSSDTQTYFVAEPLPPGEGGAAAPGEGSPPHDPWSLQIVARAALIRRWRATFSQREKGLIT
jgi:hypothetical protein